MAQPSFFSRCSELAARFRRESLTARADGRLDTAIDLERIAGALEALERRNAAEGRIAGQPVSRADWDPLGRVDQ